MTLPSDPAPYGTRRPPLPTPASRLPVLRQPDPAPDSTPLDTPLAAVRCTQCLHTFTWDGKYVYYLDEPGTPRADLSRIGDPVRRDEALRNASVLCPDTSDGDRDMPHYLPVDYVRFLKPVVIGFVGQADTGKSTLLTVMVDQVDRNRLLPYGLTAQPLSALRHQEFRQRYCDPLLLRGEALQNTNPAEEGVEFVDAYLLKHGDQVRPVAFFDVGGESLSRDDNPRATRFLRAVDVLVFSVDPTRISGSQDMSGQPSSAGDPAFETVLSRVGTVGRDPDLPRVASVIVLSKADWLRFDPIVSTWLARDGAASGRIDPELIRAESRDVYAYLHHKEATAWLRPVAQGHRCTLHVASATWGTSDSEGKYPRGVRPRRVLQPLIAALAMAGVLPGEEAEQVGR
jgi:hypothetical protein